MGKMKKLYTNNQAVELDLMNLGKAQKQILSISEFLKSKGIDPNEINIENATKKVFDIPVELFKEIETGKIKKIIDTFGETALTDNWETKVDEKTDAFKNQLINEIPEFNQTDYLKYFSFENGISVKTEFDKEYFVDKNSVILSDPKQLEFYDKHSNTCQLLNELMNHPDNEFEALDKLFYFNPDSKEFEMNILQYHDVRAEREAEKKRIEGEIYNRAMQEEYRKNQIRMKINAGEDYIVE